MLGDQVSAVLVHFQHPPEIHDDSHKTHSYHAHTTKSAIYGRDLSTLPSECPTRPLWPKDSFPTCSICSSPRPPQGRHNLHWIYRSRTSWPQWGRPQPSSWLSSLNNLHTFEVTENPGDESEFSVFEFLRDIHWPFFTKTPASRTYTVKWQIYKASSCSPTKTAMHTLKSQSSKIPS